MYCLWGATVLLELFSFDEEGRCFMAGLAQWVHAAARM